MTVTRHITKSCCGSQTFVLETNLPIRKSQLQAFKDAGFIIPDNFLQAGIFYAQLGGFIATCAYGSCRVSIRCNGTNCIQLIASFEALLDKAVNS